MIYNNMDITKIKTNIREQCIDIECTLDVLESSVNEYTIQLTEYDTRERIECDYEVHHNRIKVMLHDEPKPNVTYLIRINDIQSIVHDKLKTTIRQKLVFESDITSKINIISPSDFEKLDELIINFEEVGNNIVAKYEVQVSTENSFTNKNVLSTTHNQNSIKLNDLIDGQYYIRIRAISDTSYGLWSETVTFTFEAKTEDIIDEEEIIFEDKLTIMNKPKNNETPDKFTFVFDAELLDDIDIKNIIINKRRL